MKDSLSSRVHAVAAAPIDGAEPVPGAVAELHRGEVTASSQYEDVVQGPVRGWSRPALVVGYVLKMFPRFSETFILNEILYLERAGVEVIVFSMKKPNETLRQPLVENVRAPVLVIPPLSRDGLRDHLRCHAYCLRRHPVKYMRTLVFACKRFSWAALRKFVAAPYVVCEARHFGVEHLHAHFASGPARQAKFASMLSGIPYSFTAHAKDIFWNGHQHGANNKLKKRIRMASFVVTISDYNLRYILSLGFKIPRRRLVTVYNGLDLARWPFIRATGRPCLYPWDKPPMILAVGRLVPKKGFRDVVEACRILRSKGVAFRCVIAGEGPEQRRLESLIATAGLGGVVQLAGAVPQDRLISGLYSRAHLLVQPSVVAGDGDQDGIPTVILEALAMGLPVVATGVSGIGEAIVNRWTGLLVSPDNPSALARAIRQVLEDDALAAELAVGGRAMVETRFNLRQNVKVLVHLMEVSARSTRRWSERKIREKVGCGQADTILRPGNTDEISTAC